MEKEVVWEEVMGVARSGKQEMMGKVRGGGTEEVEIVEAVLVQLNQTMSLKVPLLYQRLNERLIGCMPDSPVKEEVRSTLHRAKWVWVGSSFVQPEEAAFKGNAWAMEPYLYVVPRGLAVGFHGLLSEFGVREEFTASDFAMVLRTMAEEHTTHHTTQTTKGGGGKGKGSGKGSGKESGGTGGTGGTGGGSSVEYVPIKSDRKLDLAVSLVQTLSDAALKAVDLEIWVPDDRRILAPSGDLVYDDAAWLAKSNHPSLAPSAETRFVHPKISNDVAAKVRRNGGGRCGAVWCCVVLCDAV